MMIETWIAVLGCISTGCVMWAVGSRGGEREGYKLGMIHGRYDAQREVSDSRALIPPEIKAAVDEAYAAWESRQPDDPDRVRPPWDRGNEL